MISIINLLNPFFKNLIYSIFGFYLKHKRLKYFNKYQKEFIFFNKLGYKEKENYLNNKLKSQLFYCKNNIPFYIEYWDKKLKSNPNIDFTLLTNWPIIDKNVVKDNIDKFVSIKYFKKKLIKISTSGSSGNPISILLDNESYSQWYSYYYLYLMYNDDFNFKDPWANIGGRIIKNANSKKPPFWIWNFGMKQLYLSSYHLNQQNAILYYKALKKYKIKYVVGYPSSIYSLSCFLKTLNLKIDFIKVIYTNAEPLLYYQKQIIKEIFNCKIIETYGSSEFILSASTNKQGLKEIWPLTGYLEILNNVNEQIGDFVLTGLVNRAMPLIRYKIGDCGSVGKMNSNNRITSIGIIEGRNDDIIISKSGKKIGRLDPIFKNNLNIIEAQIIQESVEDIKIYIIPNSNFNKSNFDLLMKSASLRLGKEFNIELLLVDSILKDKNGKFKAVISKI